MAHLRKDFFDDFFVPKYDTYILDKYIKNLKESFDAKYNAYNKIQNVKTKILNDLLK